MGKAGRKDLSWLADCSPSARQCGEADFIRAALAWQQHCETAARPASSLRQQREDSSVSVSSLSPCICSRTAAHGMVLPTRSIFTLKLLLSGNGLKDIPNDAPY